MKPGEILYGDGELELNAGRPTLQLEVTNTGDRAVQVGSHFHFFEANAALRFSREQAFGMHLDIPSGTAVRFEAGQTHQVTLVPYGGAGILIGFNGLTDGPTTGDAREAALRRASERGFGTPTTGAGGAS